MQKKKKKKKMRGESQGGKSTEKEQLQGVSALSTAPLPVCVFFAFVLLRLSRDSL